MRDALNKKLKINKYRRPFMLCTINQLTDAALIRRSLNELFNHSSFSSPKHEYPLLNAHESADKVTVTAEMAGATKEDVSIKFENGLLSISGNIKQRECTDKTTLVRKERYEGAFEKSLKIPIKIDENKVTASLNDGILTIVLPKSDEVKARVIEIK
jgi:HSP20 family protein